MANNLNIIQCRYNNDDDTKFNTHNKEAFSTGAFVPDGALITQFGIQTLPGVKFYINGSTKDYITVGQTGIYEIELTDDVSIAQLEFDAASMDMIANHTQARLIIDIIYKLSNTATVAGGE